MKINVLITLFFVILNPIFTFKCGSSQIKDIKINKVSQPENKRKLSTVLTPIKIKVDYSYLDSQQNSEESIINRLKKVLIKPLIILKNYFLCTILTFFIKKNTLKHIVKFQYLILIIGCGDWNMILP